MRTALLAFLSLAAQQAAAADFEGVLRSRMTASTGEGGAVSGTGVMYVAPAGIRMEVEVKVGERKLSFASLVLHDRPGVAYRLDEKRKTYTVDDAPPAAGESPRSFEVEKLGREKVAGISCLHVALTEAGGERFELWTASELGGAERFWRAQSQAEGHWAGMRQALHDAGADGWPLKWTEGRHGAVWETTGVERRGVDARLFDLSGYRKADQFEGMQLTPEQRKALEEMRKRRADAKAAPGGQAEAPANSAAPAAAPCEEEKPCPVE